MQVYLATSIRRQAVLTRSLQNWLPEFYTVCQCVTRCELEVKTTEQKTVQSTLFLPFPETKIQTNKCADVTLNNQGKYLPVPS